MIRSIASADVITNIKNALTSMNAITSVLYETTSSLIITSSYSNKVINITSAGGFAVIIGDSWTSGSNITNPITISSSSVLASGNIIITPNVMCITGVNLTNVVTTALFTKNSLNENIVLGFNSSSSGAANCRNTSKEIMTTLLSPLSPCLNSDGNYYKIDSLLKDGGNIVDPIPLTGMHTLLKNRTSNTIITIGNDVIINAGYTSSGGILIDCCIVIQNGNI